MESPAGQNNATNTRPTLSRLRFPVDSSSADKLAKTGSAQLDERSDRNRPSPYLSPTSADNSRAERRGGTHTNRRRVRSVHATNVLSHASSPYARSSNIRGVQRRVVGHQSSRAGVSARQRMASLDLSLYDSQSGYGDTTEDNDDPKVIADLHKALKFKTEVEDRIKAAKSNSEFSGTSPSASSTAATPSSKPYLYKPPFPSFGSDRSGRPDQDLVDFSPSIAKPPLHPVPTSSNDGATLDWSGVYSEDEKHERKWSVSLTRRVSKDKSSPISKKAIVEQQASLYAEKIARIRRRAQAQTIRKADITADQLRRRYSVLEQSSVSDKAVVRLTDIVRWFDSLDDSLKEIVDEAEPLTWLRHLHRDDLSARRRSSWVVTALIAEEFVKASCGKDVAAILMQAPSPLDVSPDRASLQLRGLPVQVSQTRSRPESLQSLEPHPHGRHIPDSVVSFEPVMGSRRSSAGAESGISIEESMRRWKTSISRIVDSPRSSLNDPVPENDGRVNQPSPLDKRKRVSALSVERTDYESSSAVGSFREESGIIIGYSHDRKERSVSSLHRRHRPHSTSSALLPPLLPKPRIDSEALMDSHLETPRAFKTTSLPTGNVENNKESRPGSLKQQSQPILPMGVPNPPPQRWLRRSLPSSVPASLKNNKSPTQRSDVREHALSLEYNAKRETLEALKVQNVRLKQLLASASKGIAEYDELQTVLCKRLNAPYTPLPSDVLEAFSHDPSAVTGNTRSSRGWRAVEDIYNRSMLQKQILQTFVNALPCTVSSVTLPSEGLYNDTLSSLTRLVDKLQWRRQAVQLQVEQLSEMVGKVKDLRDQLKPEYESAGKQTSATYPELIQLESLLDKFVNQRNRLWTLAESSISFALSSFAPFMKTFGRPIWDDLHDFLVIPWYRNDFSGEEHWYPVKFPKRTFRHWLKLTVYVISAPFCLRNGARLLVNLLTQGYSIHIPLAIPWFVIYTLYLFILLSLMSVLLGLFVVVLAEIAIVVWWSAWALRIVQ